MPLMISQRGAGRGDGSRASPYTDPETGEPELDDLHVASSIEGTGSYGAGLARHVAAAGVRVVEVDRPDRQERRRRGTSDPLAAISAARAAQSGRARGKPRGRDGAVEAIRALMVAKRSARAERTQAPAGSPRRATLTADEFTILTSWAEAMADALAFAPTSIEALAADAQPGPGWRDELRLCQPSSPLRHAITSMAQAPRTAVAANSDPPLRIALLAADDSQPGQSALDGLAAQCSNQRSDSEKPGNPAAAGATTIRTAHRTRRFT